MPHKPPLSLAESLRRSQILSEVRTAETAAELDALRARIEAGWEKVKTALEGGVAEDVLDRAKAKIGELEADLVRKERQVEIPYYLSMMLHTIARDSQVWANPSVPRGSHVTVEIPGVFSLSVGLGRDEPPF